MPRVDKLAGVFVSEHPAHVDDRGSFIEPFVTEKHERVAVASNERRCTLRGLHYRDRAEAKHVTCSRGRIFDVVVDLDTWNWIGIDIAPGRQLLISGRRLAHGYLTLEPDTDVLYLLAGTTPDASTARGVRWDDPKIGIAWPAAPAILSSADREWPLL